MDMSEDAEGRLTTMDQLGYAERAQLILAEVVDGEVYAKIPVVAMQVYDWDESIDARKDEPETVVTMLTISALSELIRTIQACIKDGSIDEMVDQHQKLNEQMGESDGQE